MVHVAIIGAGFMGKTHLTAYKAMNNAKVTAVCDLNETQGRALAEEAGCAWYADGDEMLRTARVDAVDICLPTFLHEQYALLAAKYKKHILCEKPVTLSLESLDRMLRAAEEAGVQFAVGQAVRFWPEYVKAKELYDSGALGTVKYARASRLSVHPAWSEWYRKPENSGGGLFDLHLHDIDYLCYIFGRVKQVYAVGRKNDVGCWNHVASSLTFENGVQATAEGIIESCYIKAIYSARKRVWIQTPYLIPDEVFLEALKSAARSGIDVRIMIPGRPDKKFVYYCTLSYAAELAEAGCRIYKREGFIHSKTLLIDDNISSVGSFNIDIRSFKLNFELTAFIYGTDFGRQMAEIYEADIEKSVLYDMEAVRKRSLWQRFKERLMRLASPVF